MASRLLEHRFRLVAMSALALFASAEALHLAITVHWAFAVLLLLMVPAFVHGTRSSIPAVVRPGISTGSRLLLVSLALTIAGALARGDERLLLVMCATLSPFAWHWAGVNLAELRAAGARSAVPSKFRVRTVSARAWPRISPDRLAVMMVEAGRDCQLIDVDAGVRLRCGSAEVVGVPEERGWFVAVTGDLHDVEGFMDRVARQVAQEVGEPCDWIAIG